MAEIYNCSRRVGTHQYGGNLTGLELCGVLARASRTNAGSIRALPILYLLEKMVLESIVWYTRNGCHYSKIRLLIVAVA
jgi:hypothetical protein